MWIFIQRQPDEEEDVEEIIPGENIKDSSEMRSSMLLDDPLECQTLHQETVEAYTQAFASNVVQWQWIHVANIYSESHRNRICGQGPITREKLSGTEVYASKSLTIVISWKKATRETYHFTLCPPSSCWQASKIDRRCIFL
jgi:hypothetical protein